MLISIENALLIMNSTFFTSDEIKIISGKWIDYLDLVQYCTKNRIKLPDFAGDNI